MHVLLLRHATYDAHISSNGGLNPKGQQQALEFVQRLQPQGPLPRPNVLLGSPKRRTQETLQPLSNSLNTPFLVEDDLDERRHGESAAQFYKRIGDWLRRLETRFQESDVVFICSHLDWLMDALHLIPSDLTDWEREGGFTPGEFRLFEIRAGVWYTVA